MIISIVDNWVDAEVEHLAYLNSVIDGYISGQSSLLGPKTPAYYFLLEAKHLIISKNQADLRSSIVVLEGYKLELGENGSLLIDELKDIFDYKKFIKKGSGWNAYALCKKSKTRVCPYCNHAYAFTVQSVGGDFRPTLDHFFYKDEYPHLALTLHNLIPSCATCNSSLKGVANFYTNPHLNPLFDTANIEFYFSFGGAPSEIFDAITCRRPDVEIMARPKISCAKSQRSIETFIINERYETLVVEAIDFYLAKSSFDEAVVNPQLGLSLDESTLLRFSRPNFHKYLLGKMYADIYDSFLV